MIVRKAVAGIIFVISFIYLYTAMQLEFGSLKSPQAGFMPILIGISMVMLSCIRLVQLLLSNNKEAWKAVNWYKFIFILVGIAFAIVTLNEIGYWVATLILLFYLFKIGNMDGIVKPLLLAAISSSTMYGVFYYYFAVWLP